MNSIFDDIRLKTAEGVTGRFLRVQANGLAAGSEVLITNSNLGTAVLTYNSINTQIQFVKMRDCLPFSEALVTNSIVPSNQERVNTSYFKVQAWVTGANTESVQIKRRDSLDFIDLPINSVFTMEHGDTVRAAYTGGASTLNRLQIRS
jgi:hypothetical protein